MRTRLFLAALVLGWQLHGSMPEVAKKIILFKASDRSGLLFSPTKFAYDQGRLSIMKPGMSPDDRR